MRGVTLAIGAAAMVLCAAGCANADTIPQGRSAHIVNDQDGGVAPRQEQDPDFVFNPDGEQAEAFASNSDQDEGGDIAIYQGQDDSRPA